MGFFQSVHFTGYILFQQGTFILFDKVLVIGNRMLMSAKKEFFMSSRVKKITIKKSITFYRDLQYHFPQYQNRYLMDPYSYFTE